MFVGFLNASFLRPQASDPRKSLETLAFGRILGHLQGSVFHTSRKALRKEAELKSSIHVSSADECAVSHSLLHEHLVAVSCVSTHSGMFVKTASGPKARSFKQT